MGHRQTDCLPIAATAQKASSEHVGQMDAVFDPDSFSVLESQSMVAQTRRLQMCTLNGVQKSVREKVPRCCQDGVERESEKGMKSRVTLVMCAVLVLAACGGNVSTSTTAATATSVTEGETATTASESSTVESGSQELSGDPVLVGISAPLGLEFAAALTRGAQSWEYHVNTTGGIDGRPVELKICDDEGTPDTATDCARSFLADDIQAVMSFSTTGANRALDSLLDGVVVVRSNPNDAPDSGGTFFQSAPTVAQTIEALMQFSVDRDYSVLGQVAATDADGEAAVAAYESVVARFDELELISTRVDPDDAQASAQLSRLVSQGADLVAIQFTGPGGVSLVKAYSNLGLEVPIVVNSANVTDEFVELLEGDVPAELYGAPVAVVDLDSAEEPYRSRIAQFHAEYADVHGSEPDNMAAIGRYTGDIVGAALEAVGPDATGTELAEWLTTASIESLTDLTYDGPGTGLHVPEGFDLRLMHWVDGAWVPVGS